jgi:hypothetical protein
MILDHAIDPNAQLMQSDPKSGIAVEKFKDNFMPMFELARRIVARGASLRRSCTKPTAPTS